MLYHEGRSAASAQWWQEVAVCGDVHCCMQAGAFRIGDTAGTLDNIAACKLHRPGSVGFVSKSGGMSNEMYNVLSRTTDGLYEGEHLPRTGFTTFGTDHARCEGKGLESQQW